MVVMGFSSGVLVKCSETASSVGQAFQAVFNLGRPRLGVWSGGFVTQPLVGQVGNVRGCGVREFL